MKITPAQREETETVLDQLVMLAAAELRTLRQPDRYRLARVMALYRERVPGHGKIRSDDGVKKKGQVHIEDVGA